MLIAFVVGARLAVALATINFWPAMFLTFPPRVLMLDGVGAAGWGGIRAAFAIGWWFGFGYFLSGLYWIGSAFLVDADTFGWMLPFAVTLLPAGLAMFMGLGFVAARLLWTPGQIRVLTLAAALSSAEWLRGHMFTGFPWNAFGYALTTPLPLAESVAIFGIWGLTFVAVAVFATPAVLMDCARRALMPAVLAAPTLATLAAYGGVRPSPQPPHTLTRAHLRAL